MDLRTWRKSHKLTLQQVAPIFGVSVSALSELELGQSNVSHETAARIEGATSGQVVIADHAAAWRRKNISLFAEQRAAGRSAMAAYRKTAKTRKRGIHDKS